MAVFESVLKFGICALIVFVLIIFVLLFFLMILSKSRALKSGGILRLKILNENWKAQKKELQKLAFSKKYRQKELKHLKEQKKSQEKAQEKKDPPCLFVLKFEGDIQASQVASLTEEVRVILDVARSQDEVLICLESGGGVVHGYGLAAAQLSRIKAKNIPLTIAVDKVAASGGYMMAVVADKILAAPFSIIGSIGVILQLPNFHQFLEEKGINFEQVMAGEFKRTLTLFGKNTSKGREKVQKEVDKMHFLFKEFIANHRPSLDIESVATGEHWYGSEALSLGLVDEVITSDEYIDRQVAERGSKVIEIEFQQKRSFSKRLGIGLKAMAYFLRGVA